MSRDLWLFGYGSIIWKTGFHYERAELGFIRDRARRFWQGSSDHRGTPDAPGRVVTLVDMPGETCWGMAFLIPAERVDETIVELDYREKNGYVRESVTIETRSGERLDGITYHADTSNPHFLGEAGLDEIAAQIHRSVGPSGTNKEYILELNEALEGYGIRDNHVRELARLVCTMRENR